MDQRLFGADALKTFGPDAQSALPALKKMAQDPSATEVIRGRARDAIAAIEKGNK